MTNERALEALLLIEFGKSLIDNPKLSEKYNVIKMQNRFEELQNEFLSDYVIDNGVTT